MNSIAVLLSPFWLSWKNDFLRGGKQWGRRLLLLGLAGGFWFGTYYVIRRVLVYFQSVYDLGPGLAYQLLLMIMMTFLSLLLFSNLVTSLSAFFLARDLDLVLSTRVPNSSFFYSRLATTTLNSSWMVLFFSLPIFVAYGVVFGGGFTFYIWLLIILPLFLIIPAALGVLITHLLVYSLPAKRIRDILFFIGLFSFIIIYFLFRFSQPERLVQPESFGHFLQFMAAMETPSAPFLPSSWSAEVLAGALFNRATDQGFLYALLASYALFFPLVASWVSGAVYLTGWSKAQESRQGRRRHEFFELLLNWLVRPFPEILRALMVKDIKTFLRDSTQWSQLFLLLALIVVYLYNFKVLPLDRSPIPSATLTTAVSFVNLGLAGFVLSAVAMRFAFPAVSLEGNAFWVLQTSPISLRTLLWSKFWLNFVPLLLLGEILVFLSNLLLRAPTWMMILSLVTVLLMTLGISAICVGVGALYPKFSYDHAAEIPTSFGGAVCMILSIAFIGVAVMIEAGPIYLLAVDALHPGRLRVPGIWIIGPSLAAVLVLTSVAVIVPLRTGLKNLERLKG
ncbi:MAG: putative ABC transporter permease subunit [Candidatus Binatia bacterium]